MRHPLARAAAIRVAARRGHGLVLVYHRVRADGDVPQCEVVPSLGRSRLRAQLEALAELGDIVDLPRLLDPPAARRRPRFALTFDDDYPHHAAHALPVLRDVGVPGTFFLSGRALHGLGPYWWERLEALVAADGVAEAGRALGVSGDSAQALAAACETRPDARSRVEAIAPRAVEQPLDVDGISALAAAGMTLGFHTLEHPLLPALDGDRLAAALTTGRGELAAVTGRPMTLLAYPHGKADQRVAQSAHAAGYAAAWTGWAQPSRVDGDPFLLGRWEPGPLDVDSFVAAVAVRLNRAAPASHS
jgi:peptidoglycan/xylan/chitin deacetylase (PgdA/CDA1 family)